MDVYGRYICSYKWAYKPTIITQGVTKLWCEDQTWFMIRDCILDWSIKQLISGAVNLCTHSAGARTAYLWSSSVYDRATWCRWGALLSGHVNWNEELDFLLSSGKTPEISENSTELLRKTPAQRSWNDVFFIPRNLSSGGLTSGILHGWDEKSCFIIM